MNNKVIWLLSLILVLNTVISNLIINLLIVVSFIIIGVNFKNEGILNE